MAAGLKDPHVFSSLPCTDEPCTIYACSAPSEHLRFSAHVRVQHTHACWRADRAVLQFMSDHIYNAMPSLMVKIANSAACDGRGLGVARILHIQAAPAHVSPHSHLMAQSVAGTGTVLDTRAWPLLQDLLVDSPRSAITLTLHSRHLIDKMAVRAVQLHMTSLPAADLRRVRILDLWWRDASPGLQDVAQLAHLHSAPVKEEQLHR